MQISLKCPKGTKVNQYFRNYYLFFFSIFFTATTTAPPPSIKKRGKRLIEIRKTGAKIKT